MYRERFNLAGAHRDILADGVPSAPSAPAPGAPFAVALRNYIKSVFRRGFMYRLSCKPSVVLYIAENKTLGGREDKSYEGEALGRKMAVVFFEDYERGQVRRVDRETVGMHQVLLSIAEVLQTIGAIIVPPDPARTAAQTELLYESQYEHLDVMRFSCIPVPAAPETLVFHMEGEVNAEAALAMELSVEHRTKMVHARCLQRNDELFAEETLQGAWTKSLAALRDRTAHLLPALGVAPAPGIVHDAPPDPPAPAAPPPGRGRGRGAGRGRGRGRGAPQAPAAVPAGRGRGRGRAGGPG